MCVNICLHVCKPWKPEEGIELLELALQKVVSHLVGARDS